MNGRPEYVRASLSRRREAPPAEPAEERHDGRGPRLTRETLEAEQRDEDAIR